MAQLYTRTEPTAVLSLHGITSDDAGNYRCRVDFKRSPTRYWKVHLDVIGEFGNGLFSKMTKINSHAYLILVPPQASIIMNERGDVVAHKVHKESGDIGSRVLAMPKRALEPFNELSTLILTCDVMGATPSSRVTWWANGEMIDDTYEEIAPGKSRNTMKVGTLTRNYSGAEFTCIGSNTDDNNNHAITNTVTVKMNCKFSK